MGACATSPLLRSRRIPAASFFAAPADRPAVLAALLALPGVRLAEADAPFDRPLREFADARDVPAAAAGFVVWTAATARGPGVVRVGLDPRLCDGHTFRESAEGPGLVRLQFGNVVGRCLLRSDISHPPAAARHAGPAPAAVERLAADVVAAVEALGVGRVPGRVVLAGACGVALAGGSLAESTHGRPHPAPVPLPGAGEPASPVAVSRPRRAGWAAAGYTTAGPESGGGS